MEYLHTYCSTIEDATSSDGEAQLKCFNHRAHGHFKFLKIKQQKRVTISKASFISVSVAEGESHVS